MLFGLFAQLYFLNIIRSFNGIILLDSIDMINDILLSRGADFAPGHTQFSSSDSYHENGTTGPVRQMIHAPARDLTD